MSRALNSEKKGAIFTLVLEKSTGRGANWLWKSLIFQVLVRIFLVIFYHEKNNYLRVE